MFGQPCHSNSFKTVMGLKINTENYIDFFANRKINIKGHSLAFIGVTKLFPKLLARFSPARPSAEDLRPVL